MKSALASLTLALCLVAGGFRASGQQATTDTRDLDAFTAISVGHGIDVDIRRGDAYSVELTGKPESLARVTTEVRRGSLTFDVKSGTRNLGEVRAVVKMPALDAVSASGGSDVTSGETWSGRGFAVSTSGGSDVTLALEVDDLALSTSGGSDVTLTGTAATLTVDASGGSDVDARELHAKDVTVQASGAADITVHAEQAITAAASGGADVYYYGDATRVTVNSSGGADIVKRG